MRKLLFISAVIIALAFTQDHFTVSVKDFKPAFGKWTGTLTYLDYSSGKSYGMPAQITIKPDKNNSNQLSFSLVYPDEPKANRADTVIISKDGTLIDGATVIAREKSANGSLIIITENQGIDGNDNRKATLRHTYTIGKKIFSNRKEVKFDYQDQFILRNEYTMHR